MIFWFLVAWSKIPNILSKGETHRIYSGISDSIKNLRTKN
jgi:hypothetical protein